MDPLTTPSAPPFGFPVPGNRWDLAGPPAPDLRVSVVVCHYEQPAELARTLAALGEQTRPPDEVVVTDDGSAVAPSVPAGVRLVRQEDRGFRAAAARNLGVAASTGDVVVLLDADTTPEPGFVEAMVDLPARVPEALVVGRRRHADLSGDGRVLPEPAWLASAYDETRDLLDADHASHRFVISAVLACTRWWWDLLGGCDETFTSYGGEDWELAARSWLAGGVLAHRRDAVAWHDGPDAAGRAADPSVKRAETVGVADRVGLPRTAWRGLLRGPADVVVTLPAGLDDGAVLATVDSLLAAVPTARVRLSSPHRALVGDDPRVLDLDAPLDGARLHLALTTGALGSAEAWRTALSSLDGSATDGAGRRDLGVGELVDLRLARRAGRWSHPHLCPPHPDPERSLTPWDPGRHSLEAWLGGWAP
ncbi:glycosyltransferase [Nocardioides litoris]|uniref:glycosyltransferase n=1 Tax=Nocardioides litoris TaxID=1926648 RepID=UPI001477533C|nr:glycosyltransferase [Nocardioides litoris]